MSDRITRAAVGLFLMVLVCGGMPAWGTTYFVRMNGNDEADGKTPGTAFGSMLQAAGVVGHGDAIVVGPGEYKAAAVVAERYAADGSEMRIVGDESGKLTGDAAGAVVIAPASTTDVALRLFRLRDLRVSGITFRGRGQGLKLDNCVNVVVERCTFNGFTKGLSINACKGTRVQSCVVPRCTIGVYVQGSVDTVVDHATVAGATSTGLLILGCGKGEIRNSIFTDNNTNLIGDAVSAKGWSSDFNVIKGTNGVWGDVWAVANAYEWAASSGMERHSVYVTPAFVNPETYDLHVSPEVSWGGGLPGMNVGRPMDEKLAVMDRDGTAFTGRGGAVCAGAYNYPEVKAGAGWSKLAVALDGSARQAAGIYKEDGTLVRTLLADAAGVRELYWDGRDDLGQATPAGKYVVKVVQHDVKVVDDGSVGDNGNPMGAYNCDNANRVAPLADGGFLMTTVYDEGQYNVRRYSANGQALNSTGLTEADLSALAAAGGDDFYAVVGKGKKLIRLAAPGEQMRMLNKAESFEIGDVAAGLAVVGQTAYVSLQGNNVVRVIDLATGEKKRDWAVEAVSDVAADAGGNVWAVSGTNVVCLGEDGKIVKTFATGLATPRYLAASKDRLAVVDNAAAKLAVLDMEGKVIRTLGKGRVVGEFNAVGPENMRDPRGACFLKDGRLVLTESQRVRILFADSGKISADLISNFMDSVVPHPLKSEYVYCGIGVYHVDAKTGAWEWMVEEPRGMTMTDSKGIVKPASFGSPSTSAILGGRPFVVYVPGDGSARLVDVSEPLKPRPAVVVRHGLLGAAYSTLSFARDGSMITSRSQDLKDNSPSVNRIAFKGLDAENNPIFDFAHATVIGPVAGEHAASGVEGKGSVSVDRNNDDIYLGCVTANYNKMVPAWGADHTGVGKMTADGKVRWFSLSSGGNYMSISAVNDGKQTFAMAAKSFGGQIDLFDSDGLRLATGNWNWPSAWNMGFVDMRYGVNAYLRADGKVGAYVEDDSIGRFTRVRVDGVETIQKSATPLEWKGAGAGAGGLPSSQVVAAKGLEKVQIIPKVAEMKVDGDWSAWAKAGVVPQIVALPAVTFKHTVLPEDLWQTFAIGTAIGAVAHDGRFFYVYFVVTDEHQIFDSPSGAVMWAYDSVELWIEEEQFGLGLTRDGSANLFKYRHHNLEGREWAAGYPLAKENVWAAKTDDLSSNPLGRQLADITGVSFKNKKG